MALYPLLINETFLAIYSLFTGLKRGRDGQIQFFRLGWAFGSTFCLHSAQLLFMMVKKKRLLMKKCKNF